MPTREEIQVAMKEGVKQLKDGADIVRMYSFFYLFLLGLLKTPTVGTHYQEWFLPVHTVYDT